VAAVSASANKKFPVANARPSHRDAKGQSFCNVEEREECRHFLRPAFELLAEWKKFIG
jgi:hypothetical protein